MMYWFVVMLAGSIHAENVIAERLLNFVGLPRFTTLLLVPLNCKADVPLVPLTHVAAATVTVSGFAAESSIVVPVPSLSFHQPRAR